MRKFFRMWYRFVASIWIFQANKQTSIQSNFYIIKSYSKLSKMIWETFLYTEPVLYCEWHGASFSGQRYFFSGETHSVLCYAPFFSPCFFFLHVTCLFIGLFLCLLWALGSQELGLIWRFTPRSTQNMALRSHSANVSWVNYRTISISAFE